MSLHHAHALLRALLDDPRVVTRACDTSQPGVLEVEVARHHRLVGWPAYVEGHAVRICITDAGAPRALLAEADLRVEDHFLRVWGRRGVSCSLGLTSTGTAVLEVRVHNPALALASVPAVFEGLPVHTQQA